MQQMLLAIVSQLAELGIFAAAAAALAVGALILR